MNSKHPPSNTQNQSIQKNGISINLRDDNQWTEIPFLIRSCFIWSISCCRWSMRSSSFTIYFFCLVTLFGIPLSGDLNWDCILFWAAMTPFALTFTRWPRWSQWSKMCLLLTIPIGFGVLMLHWVLTIWYSPKWNKMIHRVLWSSSLNVSRSTLNSCSRTNAINRWTTKLAISPYSRCSARQTPNNNFLISSSCSSPKISIKFNSCCFFGGFPASTLGTEHSKYRVRWFMFKLKKDIVLSQHCLQVIAVNNFINFFFEKYESERIGNYKETIGISVGNWNIPTHEQLDGIKTVSFDLYSKIPIFIGIETECIWSIPFELRFSRFNVDDALFPIVSRCRVWFVGSLINRNGSFLCKSAVFVFGRKDGVHSLSHSENATTSLLQNPRTKHHFKASSETTEWIHSQSAPSIPMHFQSIDFLPFSVHSKWHQNVPLKLNHIESHWNWSRSFTLKAPYRTATESFSKSQLIDGQRVRTSIKSLWFRCTLFLSLTLSRYHSVSRSAASIRFERIRSNESNPKYVSFWDYGTSIGCPLSTVPDRWRCFGRNRQWFHFAVHRISRCGIPGGHRTARWLPNRYRMTSHSKSKRSRSSPWRWSNLNLFKSGNIRIDGLFQFSFTPIFGSKKKWYFHCLRICESLYLKPLAFWVQIGDLNDFSFLQRSELSIQSESECLRWSECALSPF